MNGISAMRSPSWQAVLGCPTGWAMIRRILGFHSRQCAPFTVGAAVLMLVAVFDAFASITSTDLAPWSRSLHYVVLLLKKVTGLCCGLHHRLLTEPYTFGDCNFRNSYYTHILVPLLDWNTLPSAVNRPCYVRKAVSDVVFPSCNPFSSLGLAASLRSTLTYMPTYWPGLTEST
jgi:hypothetical protein